MPNCAICGLIVSSGLVHQKCADADNEQWLEQHDTHCEHWLGGRCLCNSSARLPSEPMRKRAVAESAQRRPNSQVHEIFQPLLRAISGSGK